MPFKICQSIIEETDRQNISCKCGEVILDGYNQLVVVKKDIANAEKIDDEGNTIQSIPQEIRQQPGREELLGELDMMIHSFERLPEHAMMAPITHYDFASLMILLSAILKKHD